MENSKIAKFNFRLAKLNAPTFNSKSRIINEFGITRKHLRRPGAPLNNEHFRLSIHPFNQFNKIETLLERGLEYGMGDFVYKNNAVNRRSDVLQTRTFGPEIRLDSTIWGYGKIDKALTQNTNSEEDYGLLDGLGFPELVEQNIYDETNWADMAYGGTPFSSKFTDFIWRIDDELDESERWEDRKEIERMNNQLFGLPDDPDAPKGIKNIIQVAYLLNQFLRLNDNKKLYKLPAGYNRFFSTNNQVLTDTVSGRLRLATEHKSWNKLLAEKGQYNLKREISHKLFKDSANTNIGPLGYEEGESLYDNRLLNRGWFPEKIIWDFGTRSVTKVGSDPVTLEFMADYRKSFAHEQENYGENPEKEAFKSLSWANNRVFNLIDDIVEGSGIEDDIPYSPAHSEKLWHYFEYKSRPNSEKLEETNNDFRLTTDIIEDEIEEEISNVGPNTEPAGMDGLTYGNFNLLGLNDYIVGSRVWSEARYLGGLEHAEIPGVSLAIADNELYDGLRTDFHNFLLEKLPTDPLNGFRQVELPRTVEGLDGAGRDAPGSRIPGFSAYVWQGKPNIRLSHKKNKLNSYSRLGREFNKGNMSGRTLTEMDREAYMWESFRPKDEFSFAPTTGNTQVFETEWIVDGEGWLGNVSSVKPIIGAGNLPLAYTDPISTVFTQPKGVHSIKINDEEGVFVGETNPYFSLTDFTDNRIIRGSENDDIAFPINQIWNMPSTASNQKVNSLEEEFLYAQISFSTDHDEITDNITFEETALNQRDLWWRSVELGSGNTKAKNEIGINLIEDGGEKYRDFLLSYDYRLFGKSWMNNHENKVPLKSYQFYNDSKINDWFAYRESFESANLGYSNTWNNQLYGDYTYGLFVNSASITHDTMHKYSVRVRDYLFYIFNIGTFYIAHFYIKLFNLLQVISSFVFNLYFFKFEVLVFYTKFFLNLNLNFELTIYILYPIIQVILLGYNFVTVIFILLHELANNVSGVDTGDLLENTLIIEIINKLTDGIFFKYLNIFIKNYTVLLAYKIISVFLQIIFINIILIFFFIFL